MLPIKERNTSSGGDRKRVFEPPKSSRETGKKEFLKGGTV